MRLSNASLLVLACFPLLLLAMLPPNRTTRKAAAPERRKSPRLLEAAAEREKKRMLRSRTKPLTTITTDGNRAGSSEAHESGTKYPGGSANSRRGAAPVHTRPTPVRLHPEKDDGRAPAPPNAEGGHPHDHPLHTLVDACASLEEPLSNGGGHAENTSSSEPHHQQQQNMPAGQADMADSVRHSLAVPNHDNADNNNNKQKVAGTNDIIIALPAQSQKQEQQQWHDLLREHKRPKIAAATSDGASAGQQNDSGPTDNKTDQEMQRMDFDGFRKIQIGTQKMIFVNKNDVQHHQFVEASSSIAPLGNPIEDQETNVQQTTQKRDQQQQQQEEEGPSTDELMPQNGTEMDEQKLGQLQQQEEQGEDDTKATLRQAVAAAADKLIPEQKSGKVVVIELNRDGDKQQQMAMGTTDQHVQQQQPKQTKNEEEPTSAKDNRGKRPILATTAESTTVDSLSDDLDDWDDIVQLMDYEKTNAKDGEHVQSSAGHIQPKATNDAIVPLDAKPFGPLEEGQLSDAQLFLQLGQLRVETPKNARDGHVSNSAQPQQEQGQGPSKSVTTIGGGSKVESSSDKQPSMVTGRERQNDKKVAVHKNSSMPKSDGKIKANVVSKSASDAKSPNKSGVEKASNSCQTNKADAKEAQSADNTAGMPIVNGGKQKQQAKLMPTRKQNAAVMLESDQNAELAPMSKQNADLILPSSSAGKVSYLKTTHQFLTTKLYQMPLKEAVIIACRESVRAIGQSAFEFGFLNTEIFSMTFKRNVERLVQAIVEAKDKADFSTENVIKRLTTKSDNPLIGQIVADISAESAEFGAKMAEDLAQLHRHEDDYRKQMHFLFFYVRLYAKLSSTLRWRSLLISIELEQTTQQRESIGEFVDWFNELNGKLAEQLVHTADKHQYSRTAKWVETLDQMEEAIELANIGILSLLPYDAWKLVGPKRPTMVRGLFEQIGRALVFQQIDDPSCDLGCIEATMDQKWARLDEIGMLVKVKEIVNEMLGQVRQCIALTKNIKNVPSKIVLFLGIFHQIRDELATATAVINGGESLGKAMTNNYLLETANGNEFLTTCLAKLSAEFDTFERGVRREVGDLAKLRKGQLECSGTPVELDDDSPEQQLALVPLQYELPNFV